ncbi:phosphoribosylanthranilate isomerase [Halovivax gelatinilyticus]|uniref:phosphoribosylanthranilate isomerase n=1 Tax=Halovivax gelatinilyticus TaxID=2961597 RepID=UPI0020CA5AAC|nr:phosphoribosylanthranilate isomerase [Halovivax gelatinilyticus]
MTRVKICGITRETDLAAAVEAGADAVGFVCEVPVETPRACSIERVCELIAATPPFVTTVLVTMTDVERAIDLVDIAEPDVVQIHAEYAAGDLAYLRSAVDASVVLATGVDRVPSVAQFEDLVDALVVDSVDDAGAGGTGETHDWERTRTAASTLSIPIVLAGGLAPGNVGAAVRAVEPYGVDVSTGVESAGGEKDPDAVRSFVERARAERLTRDRVEA